MGMDYPGDSKGDDAMIKDFHTRFWSRVDTSGDCWLWTGRTDKQGYGRITYQNKEMLAHRLSYQMAHGSIPDGLDILHTCDTPACVNPDHLVAGTHSDNMRDMIAKGRRRSFAGELSSTAKLTWEKVREIRQRYKNGGITLTELGREYGVHFTSIGYIVNNDTWKES